MAYKQRENTSEIIYSAALDLYQSQQIVSRKALAEVTGQKMSVVDDRLKVLVDDGLMRRVENGVYIPIFKHHESRIISKTIMPDGSIKIDIGDEVLELTPHEAMILGRNLVGEAIAISAVETGNQFAIQNEILKNKIGKLEQQIHYLKFKKQNTELFQEQI